MSSINNSPIEMLSSLTCSRIIWNAVKQLFISYIETLVSTGDYDLTFIIFCEFITEYYPLLIEDGSIGNASSIRMLQNFKSLIENNDLALYNLLISIPEDSLYYINREVTEFVVKEIEKLVSLGLNSLVYTKLLYIMTNQYQYPEYILDKVRPLIESAISNNLMKRELKDSESELRKSKKTKRSIVSETIYDNGFHYINGNEYLNTDFSDISQFNIGNDEFTSEFFDDSSAEWRKNKTPDKNLTFYYTCEFVNKKTRKRCCEKSMPASHNLGLDYFSCKAHLPKKQKNFEEDDIQELDSVNLFSFLKY
jgi:hypothetical protein